MQGHVVAQFNVGCKYLNGNGVDIDNTEAFKWHHKAALQGDVDAQISIAQLYKNGKGIEVASGRMQN